jgi:CheY-like chemotaxis protein
MLQDRAQSIDNELIALNSLLEQAEDGQMQDPLLDRAVVQACRQVWIVDDDRVTRRVHEKLIQRIFTQAEIRQYAHGGAAFEDLRRDPAAAPQVIFLDLHMPSMDGHAFLKACQTLLPGLLARTRIWVVSSSTVPEAQALQSHPLVSGYLVKPLTLGKLAAGMQGWKPPVISQRA